MKRLLPMIGLGLALSVFLAACGTSGSANNPGTGGGGIYGGGPATSTTPTPTPSQTPAATPATAASVIVRQNMSLGPILADSQGRTLYIFLPEKGGKVVCTGACLTYWPLALSKTGASPAGSPGVTGQLGAIDRSGSEQLTYNTWPLYYFAGDSGPDQTKGQGVVGFGGKWLVATPGLQA